MNRDCFHKKHRNFLFGSIMSAEALIMFLSFDLSDEVKPFLNGEKLKYFNFSRIVRKV